MMDIVWRNMVFFAQGASVAWFVLMIFCFPLCSIIMEKTGSAKPEKHGLIAGSLMSYAIIFMFFTVTTLACPASAPDMRIAANAVAGTPFLESKMKREIALLGDRPMGDASTGYYVGMKQSLILKDAARRMAEAECETPDNRIMTDMLSSAAK